MESRQYTRHLSLSELKWFAIGIGFFILSIATATVNYRLSGISLLVGLLFIIWKFSVTVLFLFTPRRMTLTETALQAGHRAIHYDALESMRLLHQSDKLILRCATVAARSTSSTLISGTMATEFTTDWLLNLSGDTVLRWGRASPPMDVLNSAK